MGNRTRREIEWRRFALVIVGVVCVPVAAAAMTVGAGGITNGGAWRASVELVDADGAPVGSAKLVEDGRGRVHVNVHVQGMTPGRHGIHVHNVGSCVSAATTFSGAGGHHNPGGVTHGSHAGDLPNLTVNGEGVGHLNARVEGFTLSGGTTSAFDADGSALVVHAAEDDLVTDPTGNSGGRIACGVIVED
jgi:superoxide dismutase, Cu-Zn family